MNTSIKTVFEVSLFKYYSQLKRPTFKIKVMAHLFQLKYKVRGEAMKNPGEGIVRIAEEEKAEMIIMGTRGLGKVR